MIEKIIVFIIVVIAGVVVFKKLRDLASGKDDSCTNCANMDCLKRKKEENKQKNLS